MKRSLFAFALVATLAPPAFAGQMQTIALFIPAMSGCPSCPFIVQSVLGEVDGVSRVETVYETGIATVVYDDEQASLDDFSGALAEYGYDIELVTPVR
ncbi:MAG: cation transporter [Alphaproteobacteria bacterium]